MLQDPWAEHLHDISDVQQKLPGTLESIREWFRTYKVPDGRFECSDMITLSCHVTLTYQRTCVPKARLHPHPHPNYFH
jgi:hypothetical protein